jgi:hypothetical protein
VLARAKVIKGATIEYEPEFEQMQRLQSSQELLSRRIDRENISLFSPSVFEKEKAINRSIATFVEIFFFVQVVL